MHYISRAKANPEYIHKYPLLGGLAWMDFDSSIYISSTWIGGFWAWSTWSPHGSFSFEPFVPFIRKNSRAKWEKGMGEAFRKTRPAFLQAHLTNPLEPIRLSALISAILKSSRGGLTRVKAKLSAMKISKK